jgi:phospholipase C
LQDPDFEPAYIFIEPNYGNILPWTPGDFTCGNSQHPMDDVTRGDRLIKDVYEAIRNSPHWEHSLLIVTHDEHGGFYDHVAPPEAIPPGDAISDADNNHNNFDFARLGVRVPAVVVSPWIRRGTIDHTQYDHTSALATLERLFGFGPLTRRDAAANDLIHLLSLPTQRTDAPVALPEPAVSGFRCEDDPEAVSKRSAAILKVQTRRALGPLALPWEIPKALRGFLHVALLKDLHSIPFEQRKRRKEVVAEFMRIRTEEEAKLYIHEVKTRLRAIKAEGPPPPIRTLRRGPGGEQAT